jgi:hypothetical protein
VVEPERDNADPALERRELVAGLCAQGDLPFTIGSARPEKEAPAWVVATATYARLSYAGPSARLNSPLACTADGVDRRTVGSSTSNSNEEVDMSKQHPIHGFSFTILFLLLLLAIATGPIGLAVLVMAGIPIAILVGIESMGHSGSKLR